MVSRDDGTCYRYCFGTNCKGEVTMKGLSIVFITVFVIFLAFGCASSGKKLTELDLSVKDQGKVIKQTMEQVDANASLIREKNNTIVEIQKKLAELENKINQTPASENSSMQEMKENVAFLNDQVLRLDNSIRTNRPVPRPQAASAFKPDGFDVKTSYEVARTEYEARRYESAISGFNELLTVAPNNSLADNAQFWIGECYYALGNFEKALDAFNKVFSYPESNKLADSHLKIGKTYQKMGNKDASRDEFKKVVQNYPGTAAAEHAKMELGKLGE